MGQALVTGGAGFIGSHLVDALVAEGESVRILDDLSTGREENLAAALATGGARLMVGSVSDLALLEEAARGCDRIFHLAATVGVRRVLADPLGGLRNNIQGTDAVLRVATRTKPDCVVLFSSSEIYGRTNGVLRESTPSEIGPTDVPRWSYAAGKVVGEFLALGEHRRSGLPVTIVRCFNTCGPRQLGAYGMVIPNFFRQALLNETMTVYGDGEQSRCFSYVGDVVRGVLTLSRHERARGEVFNIGADQEITIRRLAEKIRTLCESRGSIRFVPYEEAYGPGFEDVLRRVPDLTKIRSAIAYRPECDLDRLLAITKEWVAQQLAVKAPAI